MAYKSGSNCWDNLIHISWRGWALFIPLILSPSFCDNFPLFSKTLVYKCQCHKPRGRKLVPVPLSQSYTPIPTHIPHQNFYLSFRFVSETMKLKAAHFTTPCSRCLPERNLNSTGIGVEGGNRKQKNEHYVASARHCPVYNDLKIITGRLEKALSYSSNVIVARGTYCRCNLNSLLQRVEFVQEKSYVP